eukprot:CAMPEP_0118889484 /NCGR_PEP_ID=MMETSP1166-20130328/391_1 /TAXON_ID=1104430 /ORGANISM="Chrysoreinhardia sp, Strain CCMP3193" /LENGTH=242 /DNA_ID=CAMNT_0006828075 /DNA_START=99 /DNA_END=827 /DNA_ORIENTATION=-
MTGSSSKKVVARALYRASLRAVRSLEGRPLPIQRPIREGDWGSHHVLSRQSFFLEREEVFPFIEEATDGLVTAQDLRDLVRRRYRQRDQDVDDGFRALKAFHDLAADLEVSSLTETRGIRVLATSRYLGVNRDSKGKVFAYRIRVSNVSHPSVVQLRSRHWIVKEDGSGAPPVIIPKGSPGVVGKTPRLLPGTHFEYVSGTEIHTTHGSMEGSFEMASDDGDVFDAIIHPFKLDADHVHAAK